MATSYIISMERKLQMDPYLRAEYIEFMNEYLKMGHMQEVIDKASIPVGSFYLSYYSVLKVSSLITKVRIVFNASARSSSDILSFNDILMCGPTIQEDLFSILMYFRRHQFIKTSDIEKMFS